MKFLDMSGLSYLWGKIKSRFDRLNRLTGSGFRQVRSWTGGEIADDGSSFTEAHEGHVYIHTLSDNTPEIFKVVRQDDSFVKEIATDYSDANGLPRNDCVYVVTDDNDNPASAPMVFEKIDGKYSISPLANVSFVWRAATSVSENVTALDKKMKEQRMVFPFDREYSDKLVLSEHVGEIMYDPDLVCFFQVTKTGERNTNLPDYNEGSDYLRRDRLFFNKDMMLLYGYYGGTDELTAVVSWAEMYDCKIFGPGGYNERIENIENRFNDGYEQLSGGLNMPDLSFLRGVIPGSKIKYNNKDCIFLGYQIMNPQSTTECFLGALIAMPQSNTLQQEIHVVKISRSTFEGKFLFNVTNGVRMTSLLSPNT